MTRMIRGVGAAESWRNAAMDSKCLGGSGAQGFELRVQEGGGRKREERAVAKMVSLALPVPGQHGHSQTDRPSGVARSALPIFLIDRSICHFGWIAALRLR